MRKFLLEKTFDNKESEFYSDQFLFGAGKCRFVVHHKGNNNDLCLEVADYGSLPFERKKKQNFTLL